MPKARQKLLGHYIIADPDICHGKPTFRGTRIMVTQVLKQIAKGIPWDVITAEWRGAVSKEAIAEAVELAQRIFEDHAGEYAPGIPAGMNILDENIPESQRKLLRGRRVPVRQIGLDVGRKGMKDNDVIPLLHQLDRPTFFTLDGDFYDRRLCHVRYCLIHLDLEEELVAEYVRRFLRHPSFDSKAKRMGRVIRVLPTGLAMWRGNKTQEEHLSWK